MTSPTLPQIVEDLSEAMRRDVTEGNCVMGSDTCLCQSPDRETLAKMGIVVRREPLAGMPLTVFGREVRTHLLSLGEGM